MTCRPVSSDAQPARIRLTSARDWIGSVGETFTARLSLALTPDNVQNRCAAVHDVAGEGGVGCGRVTPDERWLAAVWPFVRTWLPAPPAAVAEIGCGPLGGFVPMLRSAGYDATGVDPQAPEGPWYQRAGFEHCEMPRPAHAVVACTSLHHVADLGEVLNLAGASLVAGGTLVVV